MRQPLVIEQIWHKYFPNIKDDNTKFDDWFESSYKNILESFITKYLETRIKYCVMNSIASEHGARMTAMDNATTNEKDMVDKLKLSYN